MKENWEDSKKKDKQYRWCIIELYTWHLCNPINHCHPNTFNEKLKIKTKVKYNLNIKIKDNRVLENKRKLEKWEKVKIPIR